MFFSVKIRLIFFMLVFFSLTVFFYADSFTFSEEGSLRGGGKGSMISIYSA